MVFKSIATILFIGFLAFAFYTSPADIESCVNKTGWSKERCQIELTR